MTPTKKYIELCMDKRVVKKFPITEHDFIYRHEKNYTVWDNVDKDLCWCDYDNEWQENRYFRLLDLDDLWEWAMEIVTDPERFTLFSSLCSATISDKNSIYEILLSWVLENIKEK